MDDRAALAEEFVRRKIFWLADSPNSSATKAALAKLRRGIGKEPGSMPEIWDVTLEGLPEKLTGGQDSPTRGEWAVHTALTLYALHQQGKDPGKQCMSRDGQSLGAAVRRLIRSDEDRQRVKRRFDAAATSASLQEFSHHLRGLIQLLKAEDISLDYPALAKDLYWFQFSDARSNVRLRWGRDFCRNPNIQENDEGKDGNRNEN